METKSVVETETEVETESVVETKTKVDNLIIKYSKYCKSCNYYYYRKYLLNNNIYNYHNYQHCNCGTKYLNYNIISLIDYKLYNYQHKLIHLIWDLYGFNNIYNTSYKKNFCIIVQNILKITYKKCCNINTDLLFIIAGALILKNKRYKNTDLFLNFNHALFILSLDFYFATIFISDFNYSLFDWNKYVYEKNTKFITNIISINNDEMIKVINFNRNYIYKNNINHNNYHNLIIYYLYINYLKNIDFNIYISDDIIYQQFENIINI